MRRRVTWILIAACWLIAITASLEIARRTAIGGVVFKLTARHGVHVGDLVATGTAAVAAGAATLLLWPRKSSNASD